MTLTQVVALIAILVAPLYGLTATILWRLGVTRRTGKQLDNASGDISDLETRLRNVERSLARLERTVEYLSEDHEMLHDHLADENHCGSEHCRFCERD